MIMINVEVPIMGESYDFQIEEHVAMGYVIKELATMISQKNQCRINGDKNNLRLWEVQSHRLLDLRKSATANGLVTGSLLMLA